MADYKLVNYDKERKLKFDFSAIVDFEQASGITMANVDISTIGFYLLQTFMWAGLKHEDKELTQSLTGKLMHKLITSKKHSLKSLGTDIGEALALSGIFEIEDDKKPGNESAGNQ